MLKARGLNVKIKKIDPYLNVDPGTLSPYEHGEVFVTKDGTETDLDLGHYERLGGVSTSKDDYITSGLIYNSIIQKERKGEYLGKTVMVVPHVIQEFKEAILKGTEDCDILICEVGGTVGDIEGVPILETARQLKQNFDASDVIFVHVALLPFLKKAEEWKTKPIQHSFRTLLSYGIQPDLLLCRMESKNEENWKQKISMLCNIKEENVLEALDAPSIYHAMLNYQIEGVAERMLALLNMQVKSAQIPHVERYVKKLDEDLEEINIAVVGKYTSCKDAYKSLEEALNHAAIGNDVHIKIDWINAEEVDEFYNFSKYHGILVPGGFGIRAANGKMNAIKTARKKNIPYFGICFGMQLAIIEGLNEILDGEVSSSEFGECLHPVIAKMDEWYKDRETIKAKLQMGGSMRLGLYPCEIKPGTLTAKIYGETKNIQERHRHRYEVNNNYLQYFKDANIVVSGECNGLVEIIERTDCDFFVAVQFHPEFNSSVNSPNKLFLAFIDSAKKRKHSL